MSNMSYCRFQNTLHDLRDCYAALRHGEHHDMCEEEERACVELLQLCERIGDRFDTEEIRREFAYERQGDGIADDDPPLSEIVHA